MKIINIVFKLKLRQYNQRYKLTRTKLRFDYEATLARSLPVSDWLEAGSSCL